MDFISQVDKIGAPKGDLETPALLVDLEILDQNIKKLAAFCEQRRVNWRPHIKAVKVPELAEREIAAGAIGVACGSLREAEIMMHAGVKDVLITNQVVGAGKIARLVNLIDRGIVTVSIDSIENARELSAAAERAGKTFRVVIEVNIGMDRAGVEPGQPVVTLASSIRSLRGLRFMGVTGYEGDTCTYIKDREEKRLACEKAVGMLISSAELCRDAGHPCAIVSASGTVSAPFTAHLGGLTEVQAGGGIVSDISYEQQDTHYPFALTVLSTVTSRPAPGRIIVDAGRKALSVDKVLPRPRDLEGVELVRLSAEHGRIFLKEPNTTIKIGEKLEWIVGYTDTTVLLHNEMIGIRNGIVETVWTIPR
jgi:D-serine deaminase-like pyridoxal phosphate-dependent protein